MIPMVGDRCERFLADVDVAYIYLAGMIHSIEPHNSNVWIAWDSVIDQKDPYTFTSNLKLLEMVKISDLHANKDNDFKWSIGAPT